MALDCIADFAVHANLSRHRLKAKPPCVVWLQLCVGDLEDLSHPLADLGTRVLCAFYWVSSDAKERAYLDGDAICPSRSGRDDSSAPAIYGRSRPRLCENSVPHGRPRIDVLPPEQLHYFVLTGAATGGFLRKLLLLSAASSQRGHVLEGMGLGFNLP